MYPISDKRYTITKEFTGKAEPQWVARFCGEWISHDDIRECLDANELSPRFMNDEDCDDE